MRLFVACALFLMAVPALGAEDAPPPKVIYPKNTKLDFSGVSIDGELKNPAEFYFQRREEDKFDSLVKRRKNFHREMLRDAVMSR